MFMLLIAIFTHADDSCPGVITSWGLRVTIGVDIGQKSTSCDESLNDLENQAVSVKSRSMHEIKTVSLTIVAIFKVPRNVFAYEYSSAML